MLHLRTTAIHIAIPIIAQLVVCVFLLGAREPAEDDFNLPGETPSQIGESDQTGESPVQIDQTIIPESLEHISRTPDPGHPTSVPQHPAQPDSLRGLAIAHHTSNRPDDALEAFRQMVRSRQEIIERTGRSLSETERMRLLEKYPPIDSAFLSFALETNSAPALESALKMVLQGKETRIDIFAVEKTEPDAPRFEIRDIADALPEGAVLWEFVEYEPYDFKKAGDEQVTGDQRPGSGQVTGDHGPGGDKERTAPSRPDAPPSAPARYLAFTLDRAGRITLKDLGAASEIDSLVLEARRMIHDVGEAAHLAREEESERRLAKVTGSLYRKIFQPLKPGLGANKTILVSPDGQLNLLPFEILPAPDGKYVIETYRVSYLSSGRDLLKSARIPERPDWAMVLASPNFDLSDDALARKRDRLMNRSGTFTMAYASSRGASDCLKTRFSPLRLTHFEANSVALSLEKRGGMRVEDCQGSDALEEVLKMMEKPPRVLHLATHGFFCEDQSRSEDRWLENPLLRSGLALSGANRLMDSRGVLVGEGDDGILTAYEVSGLNLVGTELAVLSACETGVVGAMTGEGVYGLRRACQRAGAETIVMSLWKVPDKETFRLMDQFYKTWLGGQGRREALRQASLNVLADLRKQYKTAHPLLWSGFILVGNPD